MALPLKTLEAIKARAAKREKRGTIEPSVPTQHPKLIEKKYAKALRSQVQTAAQVVKEELLPQLDTFVRQSRLENPRFDAWTDDLFALLGSVRVVFAEKVPESSIRKTVRQTGQSVDTFAANNFDRQLRAVAGVSPFVNTSWLPNTLDLFARQNVTLIKTVHEDYFKDIEVVVVKGLEEGKTAKQIAKEISERTGVTERRANLIARDQVASLNSNLAAKRATELGVTRFRWQTSEDERVRASHSAVNQKIYTYEKGAEVDGVSGVLPGRPINCRCTATPIISSIVE